MSVEFQNANRKGFVIVPNELARNSSLKRSAKGLLIELLSHSDGFVITEASLISSGQEGRDAIRRSIRELEEAGFLERRRIRNESNHFTGIRYIVHDHPVHDKEPSDSHNADFQSTGSQSTGFQSTENRTLKKNHLKEDQDKKTKEENLLVEDESPTMKIPVTGNRLIHPKTGEPATDAERLEIFNSFSDKLASMMVNNGARRPKPSKAWTDAIRLLLESDGIHPRDAWEVLVWSQHDGFWRKNIHSLPKFREKYDQLLMAMREKQSGGSRKKSNAEQGHDLVAKYEAMEQQQAAMSANWSLGNGAVVPEIEYSAEEVYEG